MITDVDRVILDTVYCTVLYKDRNLDSYKTYSTSTKYVQSVNVYSTVHRVAPGVLIIAPSKSTVTNSARLDNLVTGLKSIRDHTATIAVVSYHLRIGLWPPTCRLHHQLPIDLQLKLISIPYIMIHCIYTTWYWMREPSSKVGIVDDVQYCFCIVSVKVDDLCTIHDLTSPSLH